MQLLRRLDVVLVVALDLREQLLVAGLQVALVVDDAGAGGLHLIAALTAVERLDVLDRVRRGRGPDRFARDAVQVHQPLLAQQPVEERLARGVARRELLERGVLVGGVVVDAHVAVLLHAGLEPVHEGFERVLFLRAVVRPERLEDVAAVAALPVPDAEQVLEPVVTVERVAFHVEVDVAVVGVRQLHQPGGDAGGSFDELELRLARVATQLLHRGLVTQLGERLRGQVRHGVRGFELRELLKCSDASGFQLLHLARTDVGDLVQAVLGCELCVAMVLPVALWALGAGFRFGRIGGCPVVDRVPESTEQPAEVP